MNTFTDKIQCIIENSDFEEGFSSQGGAVHIDVQENPITLIINKSNFKNLFLTQENNSLFTLKYPKKINYIIVKIVLCTKKMFLMLFNWNKSSLKTYSQTKNALS